MARRNHYIMAVFLPSACQAFRNWQAFKTVRLFLDEGHSIKLSSSSSSSVVSNAWSPGGHPGRVNTGQDISAPPPQEGHRAGCGFWRMYVNESTASVQQRVRDAFRNVPDLNKDRPDSDRGKWTALQSYLLLHIGTSGCEAE